MGRGSIWRVVVGSVAALTVLGCPSSERSDLCVAPNTDTAACGEACGACADGSECRDGRCACGDQGECAENETCCGGQCVDLTRDALNCGVCHAACGAGDAQHTAAVCIAGTCQLACAAPFARCPSDDPAATCTTNLDDDVSNCGVCGQACTVPSGLTGVVGPACEAGECGLACSPGRANCDTRIANGCEIDVWADEASCGACGHACPVPGAGTHGSALCLDGSCGVACETGWASCGAAPADGCPVNTDTDLENCGQCDRTCALTGNHFSAGRCEAGQCRATCASSYGDCDGDLSNGCETFLVSPVNCGACGRTCPANTYCGGTTCVPVL